MVGVCFMKYGKVIDYSSSQLNTHAKNYLTHDLELEMVIYSSKI